MLNFFVGLIAVLIVFALIYGFIRVLGLAGIHNEQDLMDCLIGLAGLGVLIYVVFFLFTPWLGARIIEVLS